MARCLKHSQLDPLPLKPLTEERVDYFWGWIQENLNTFDDYTPLSRWEFEFFLFGPVSESYEIGDGVGLTTLVFDGVNAYVQMIMLDWKFRPDVCKNVCQIAFDLGAARVTATVSEDRASARELVSGLGFEKEGVMRQAFLRQGIKTLDMKPYHDVEIWGLTREKWLQQQQ